MFLKANAASLRALAGGTQHEVRYVGQDSIITNDGVRLPAPPRERSANTENQLRGASDAAGLWLAHHNKKTHQRVSPKSSAAKMVFEAAEKARVEAIGSNDMAGVRKNLTERLEIHYTLHPLGIPSPEASDQLENGLSEAVRLIIREKLTGEKPPAAAGMAMDLWRPFIESRAGDLLEEMKSATQNQAVFADFAKQLIGALQSDLGENSEGGDDGEGDDDSTGNQTEDDQEGEQQAQSATGEDDSDGDDSQSVEMEGDAAAMAAEDGVDDDSDEEMEGQAEGDAPGGDPRDYQSDETARNQGYRVFTDKYDEIIEAAELCDSEELDRLRGLLDRHLESLTSVIAKLANRLQRKLMAYQNRSWDFDLEEGVLDAGKLHRVVTQPLSALSFKQEQDTKFRDTIVTLLLDNSGSMRGRPITIAAVTADILARTLERCGVKVEILGFTTKAWKGGQSREAWQLAGKPDKPGRLNDLRHIIYKAGDIPYRRARRSLGLMLREGILKENIDGEALLWAHNRLLARHEDRQILMVISDGAPVDDSTLSANSGNYLEKHLRQVIAMIQERSPVELLAIGIGHDVTRYYERAVTITDAEQLGGAVMTQLADLFDENAKPPRKVFS
ncbi:cobaltochelatase subunit CobT [Alphaproteobacteria bacterium]|nr:cobaltochelatase subunit CobT [Alphaproteobacteria bacterium]RCL80497.1 MAG: cobaltochelatase subunit CobT [SAR116 cluster bacterium]CAI8315153.1 MAG: Aerobic cobaltochelatase subunit CobT [SAR116 cluster bacterium]